MKTATVKKEVQQPLINMKYGAPELLSLYQRYAFRGLMYAIVCSLLLIGSVAAYNSLHATGNDEKEYNREIILLNYDLPVPPKPVEEIAPIDVPKAEQTVKLKDLAALVPQPVAKQESEALTTKTQQALENVPTEQVGKEGTDDISKVTTEFTDKLNDKIIEDKIKTDEPKKPVKETFNSFEVEKSPVPVNLSSVRGSMKYPEIALSSGVEGTCVAKILVGTTGEILKVSNISGPDVFHSEIERKIMDLQFTPALQGGQPVKCYVNVPFKFNLK
ncbi:MAG: energy transducer TonB [Ignavibacteria bacterium]|nr:energy transducer TonB [Ignavibacteria bacterium]